jgi:hypothetical protein
MDETDKPLVWLHGEVKTPPFSKETRVETGVLLRRLQRAKTWGCSIRDRCRVLGRVATNYGFEMPARIGELSTALMRTQF